MEVYWISSDEVRQYAIEELRGLLDRRDGFVWVDIPVCDEQAVSSLSDKFGLHPLAVRDCLERTHIPKVHAYPDNVFLILHAPELGEAGHVHLLELDQFVSDRFLVTVHGPLGIGVSVDTALRETRAVLARMKAGRFRPESPFELSYGIVSALTRRMSDCIRSLANDIAGLEQRVMKDDLSRPEPLIQQMFLLRHEVVTIGTMAAQCREIYVRMASIRMIPSQANPFFEDLRNQFDAVSKLAEGESRFLEGVVDFYQTRIGTELNQFAKRLTAVGAILVFNTLIAGIYGMNFRHMPELNWAWGYPMTLGLMVLSAVGLAWFFRRKHWL
jgi:magnesium transporter